MKNFSKIFAGCLFITGCLVVATPAKAFYFELPTILKTAIDNLKIYTAAAQESTEQPAVNQPQSTTTPEKTVTSTCMVNGVEQPGSCEQTTRPGQTNQQPQQGPASQPGSQGQTNQGGQTNQPGQMNQQPQQGPMNQPGPDNEQMLKNMKRGASDVERQLKNFESQLAKFEKKGVTISDSIKTKVTELKTLIQKFQSVTSAEEIQNLDINDLQSQMRDLEEERQNLEQTSNIMNEMKRIEANVKTFEKQVAKLAKQNIPMPSDLTDNLTKVKALITEIKAGKMDNAQDIFDLVQELDQSRGLMEMLSRWPQTLKQMDREIKNLDAELKRDKTIVTRLNKKGIDLSSVYSQFEDAIKKLKETRDAAKAQVSGSPEDAFDLVQNDFFGQMQDIWESSKIIMAMSNFTQFQSNSSRELAKAQQQINALKKKKIDTSELAGLLAQAKTKVAEVKELSKAKPLDPDAIIDALSELQNLNQDFGDLMAELTGTETAMPWETGSQPLQQIQVSPTLDKLIPRQSTPTSTNGAATSTTCNINGVEVTGGACQQ